MTASWATAPRCAFYVRTQVAEDPTYRYDPIHILSPESDGMLRTPWPPSVGDLIHLFDSYRKNSGTYRVLERAWSHAMLGSHDWSYVRAQGGPTVGPLLHMIVEPAEGLFVNEAEADDTEEGDE